jgi:hypothetical protein
VFALGVPSLPKAPCQSGIQPGGGSGGCAWCLVRLHNAKTVSCRTCPSSAAKRDLRFVAPFCRMKCFCASPKMITKCRVPRAQVVSTQYTCAWLATCVGVREGTKYLEMPLQLPLPSFLRPCKKSKCSVSVQGAPAAQVKSTRDFANSRQPWRRYLSCSYVFRFVGLLGRAAAHS